MKRGEALRKLKFFRLIDEKTQRQLAKEAGCSQSLISLFEKGKVIPLNAHLN